MLAVLIHKCIHREFVVSILILYPKGTRRQGRQLFLTMWIFELALPITLTLYLIITAVELTSDSASNTSENSVSEPNESDEFQTISLEHCTSSEGLFGSSATCNNNDNITLGPHEFVKRGFNDLIAIEIDNCRHVEIGQSAFDGLPYLKYISIRSNGTLKIHPDTLQKSSQPLDLTIIHTESLYHNQFRNGCTNEYLFDARSLTALFFSMSDYNCWSPSTLSGMPNLTRLALNHSNFVIFPGIFSPLRKLEKLRIAQENHLNIMKDTFDGINIRFLHLVGGALGTLFAMHIPSLKDLHLRANELKNIDRDDFIGMPVLRNIYIENNNVETIHEDAFSHLTQLETLHFHGNKIASFTANHLRNNLGLKRLIISDNKNLKHLPVFRFNNTADNSYSFKWLRCTNCGLESILEGTFNNTPMLHDINLKNNQLKLLPPGLFSMLSSLTYFDLSNNLISNIPDDMFEGAIEVWRIELRGNPLTTLKLTPFLQTPKLKHLDLSHCQIKIWSETNIPLHSLRVLSLEHNDLERITVEHMKTVPNLSELQVISNPIKCDNEFNDTITWLLSHDVTTKFENNPYNSYCTDLRNDPSCWNFIQKFICNLNNTSEANQTKFGDAVN